MKKTRNSSDASPLKSAAEELDQLRRVAHETVRAFGARLEAEIAYVREAVAAESAKGRKLTAPQLRDLGDMISLMRRLDVRPGKGRRRDLKRLEGLAEDLRRVVDGW